MRYSDDFRAELKKGFLEAVGSMADYRIRLNACGWVDKDVLTEEDFLEICDAINAQYIIPEPPVVEETEIENETILDGEAGTEIIEDSTNEDEVPETESTEQTTEEVIEEPATETTE